MAPLVYASNVSLDGCTEDEHGAFDWSRPDDDVFAFITGLMRSAGTYLYGRRMYETLAVWETDPNLAAQALAAGLVDEIALFVWPVVLGGGNPALRADTRVDLALTDEHRFDNGTVYLRYRVE